MRADHALSHLLFPTFLEVGPISSLDLTDKKNQILGKSQRFTQDHTHSKLCTQDFLPGGQPFTAYSLNASTPQMALHT